MKFYYLILITLLLPVSLFAQDKAEKKYEKELYEKANEQMYEENYTGAQESYLKLLEVVPNNDLYLLETGLAYFFASTDSEKSLKYFELAKQFSRPDTLVELFYYLGRSYQLNSDFETAVTNYEKFKSFLKDNKTGREMTEEIDGYVRMCQHGQYHLNLFAQDPVKNSDSPIKDLTKYFMNDSVFVAIENLGKKINSQYSDYTPLILNNKTYLAFTSRRNRIDGESNQLFDGQYFEKIYVSRKANGEWKQPVEVNYSSVFGESIKNPDNNHNAAIYLNQDENILLTYSNNKIYQLNRVGDKWSSPMDLGEEINSSDGLQSSAAISNDGNTIFIVSERKKGFGGRDIYYAEKKSDGTWGKLENIGATVNSEKDEESPYITADNKKLYFASQGHSSIGGYDIFVTEKNEKGKWQTPRSLGVPINSPADEIYYFPKDKGQFAYYSSSRPGGYGDIDMYMIYKGVEPKSKGDKQPSLASADSTEPKKEVKMVEGEIAMVFDENANQAELTESSSSAVEESLNQEIAQAEVTEEVNTEETVESVEEEVTEVKETTIEEIKEEPKLEEKQVEEIAEKVETTSKKEETGTFEKPNKSKTPPVVSKPQTKSLPSDVLANLDFGFNSNVLSEDSKNQLKRLAEELKNNPNVVLTLNGHADYLGTNEVNNVVSKQRAMMVYKYLVEVGSEPNQLRLDYFGEDKPLVNAQMPDGTDIPENRAKNRRVEFETKEFSLYRFVLYGFDSYALSTTSNQTLDDVVKYLQSNPNAKAQLNGYTDKIGNIDYNKYLSSKRVDAVYNYLTKAGIKPESLEKNSFGVENPAIPDGSGVDQKYNRRVEILIN